MGAGFAMGVGFAVGAGFIMGVDSHSQWVYDCATASGAPGGPQADLI